MPSAASNLPVEKQVPGPKQYEDTRFVNTTPVEVHDDHDPSAKLTPVPLKEARPFPVRLIEVLPFPAQRVMAANALMFSKAADILKWLQANISISKRMRQTPATGDQWTILERFLGCELRLFCLRTIIELGMDERHFHHRHNDVIERVFQGLVPSLKQLELREFLKDSDSQDILDEVEIFTNILHSQDLKDLPTVYDPSIWQQLIGLVSHSDQFLKRIAQESIVLAMFGRMSVVLDYQTLDRRMEEFKLPDYLDKVIQVLGKFDEYIGKKDVREKTAYTFLFLRPETSPVLKYTDQEDKFYQEHSLANPFVLMEISQWAEPPRKRRYPDEHEEMMMMMHRHRPEERGFWANLWGGH